MTRSQIIERFPDINIILEIPHLNFKKLASSIFDDGKYIYIMFFLTAKEAIGHWGKGKIYIKSILFKRKRMMPKETIIHYGIKKIPLFKLKKSKFDTIEVCIKYNKLNKKIDFS